MADARGKMEERYARIFRRRRTAAASENLSHQRSAGGTNFRTRLLFAAAEKSAHSALPFFHAHLPLIGKGQFSSLRPANGVPIIQKSPLFFSARRIYQGHPPWTNSKSSANASTRNSRA